MPIQECDSSDKYSEKPSTSYHLTELLDQFQQLLDQLAPPLEHASHQPTHTEELLQLAEGLQQLAVALQLHPNPKHKEEPMHTNMQANITMTLLLEITTLDGQDSSQLEYCFMDIKTATDILTRSHTCLAKARTHGLTCTLICTALPTGTPLDTRVSKHNNLPNTTTKYSATSVPFHILKLSPSAVLLQTPWNNNHTLMMDVSRQLTSPPPRFRI